MDSLNMHTHQQVRLTPARSRVMLVDDNVANLTAYKNMLKEIFEVYTLPSALRMFEVLEKVEPDLILLDIEMPGMNGYEAIAKLKRDKRYEAIPVIFLTSRTDEGSEMEGLNLGAIDYVYKPFSPPLLIQRIRNYLHIVEQRKQLEEHANSLMDNVEHRLEQISHLEIGLINTLAEMVEHRDGVTGGHVARTHKYMGILINALYEQGIYSNEIENWNIDMVLNAAKLHDVGKISTPDAILRKPGKLTDEEFAIMKEHAFVGEQIIIDIQNNTGRSDFLHHAKLIAGTHHEKWDGSGYPRNLVASEIPLEGRLMAIADVYDAMVSVRPYKKALSHKQAETAIIESSGSHFDPVLVGVFTLVKDQFASVADESITAIEEGTTDSQTAVLWQSAAGNAVASRLYSADDSKTLNNDNGRQVTGVLSADAASAASDAGAAATSSTSQATLEQASSVPSKSAAEAQVSSKQAALAQQANTNLPKETYGQTALLAEPSSRHAHSDINANSDINTHAAAEHGQTALLAKPSKDNSGEGQEAA
ncbi:MAG: response regulator [Coriobacteriales bacterium]|jgi:putative two-component system response regulator|nr:response regulator [Coriobacteriales bacterium]